MYTQPIHEQQTIASNDAVKVLIAFERPSSTTLKQLNRGDRFRTLIKRCEEQRANLLEWAMGHHLQDEILRVGEPTAFNMIFAEVSPRAIEQLLNAPEVEQIVQVNESEFETAEHSRNGFKR